MKGNNPHSGHRQRLRDQVLKGGLDAMHEHQVLEYLLTFVLPQKDTNVIAHDLISKFGGFSKVFEADLNELKKVKGVGEVVAHFLYNFRDFYFYYQKNKPSAKGSIKGLGEAKQYMMPYFVGKQVEELYVVAIDSKNRVIDTKLICEGVVNEANVNMRLITQFLISNNATNFVLAHNHPDGKCLPSVADDNTTRAVVAITEINGIRMLDHIIFGEDETYSYHHSGKLDKYREDALKLCMGKIDMQDIAKYEGKK